MPATIENPAIVSREQWLEARTALLAREKALTRMRDAISAERRALPWVKVEKEYTFDTPAGPQTLADLFRGRSQLIIYHFMWRREFGEGCVGCSFLSDHVDGPNQHLAQHDVSFVAVARAPLTSLLAFKERMGWKFEMVSSLGSDFNFDYHVSFTPGQLATGEVDYNFRQVPASIEELSGISVFYRPDNSDNGRTYFTPTQAMLAATKRFSAPTCGSTSPRRDATKMVRISRWATGCATTTATTRADTLMPAAPTLPPPTALQKAAAQKRENE